MTAATKTIHINRPAADSYAFLADPATMPQWAIHNVRAIHPLGGGRWEMDTPRGNATLIPHYEKHNFILDHEFLDAGEGRWQVTARVVPTGPSESVYIITLPKPDALPSEAFEAGMRLMEDELAALKACIEALPKTPPSPTTLVEALYEAFRRRDMPAIFALFSPDIEIEQSTDLPWGGTYRGHDGARQFFGKLGSHINSTLALDRLVSAGDHVAAIGWTEGKVNATGARYRVPIVHLWQIRGSHIVRGEFFIDHPKMMEALA